MKKRLHQFLPYLLIIVVACLIMLPQIMNKSFFAGDDSVFHMNRFYDAAMQIKTGKFNYFQTNFGFQQTGRIINALYGPIFAYLNGMLLLILHGWVRYEIISSLLILGSSGCIMYAVAKRLNISSTMSFILGLLYMLSNQITAWVFYQQFTGWGACLIPLVMLAGIKMVQNGDISVLQLAIPMALILQIHVLSSLIGVLALIPFFIVALIKSHTKASLVKHSLLATLLTILLTGNIWSAILDIMGSNHLMPVFPVFNMQSQAISLQPYALRTIFGPGYLLLALLVILITIFDWRQINFTFKVNTMIGLCFLWLSSALFPWNTLVKIFPNISDTIQFPKRFVAVALTLLLLSLGHFLSHAKQFSSKWIRHSTIILIVILPLLAFARQVQTNIHTWQSARVIPKYNILMVYTNNSQKIRHAYRTKRLRRILGLVVKPSPDYLPIKHPLAAKKYTAFRPYHLTHYTLTNRNHQLKHYHVIVKRNGTLLAKWYNPKAASQQRIPLVKYRHSIIKANGRLLHAVSTNRIGVIKLTSYHGWNRVTLAYQPRRSFKLATIVAGCTWILMLEFIIIRHFKSQAHTK